MAVVGNYPLPPNSNPSPRTKHSQERKQIIYLLQKCKNINQITPIHAQIIRNGHEQDPFIVFELLRVSSNCNSIDYASKVFQQIQNPNVYLYTALIDGFVKSGSYLDGIRVYSQMVEACVMPDNYVVSSVLKACGSQLGLKEGREIHAQALKLSLSSSRSVRMKLVELYGKCGEFEDAWLVFDEMPERDIVALTVMISCYVDHGLVEEARNIFDGVQTKDTVCWTAMIDGFVRNGEMNKALELFRDMQREGMRPNEVTIVCVLSVCSQLGALGLGRWVHSYVGKYGIELNHFVGSALINMYSRCGSIDEAERVFEGLKERDVTTYNSMIAGLALNGKSIESVEMFRQMVKHGIRPTNITFVGVLNACSHGGMVELGFQIFETMTENYKIEPQIEHYGCMVDLLGRVGRLEEAYNFIRSMKTAPDHIIWGSLLSACKIHGNSELGEQAAKVLLDCGDADSGTYVLLSNVYASSGKWGEAAQVRAKIKLAGIQKEPGCSLIEVKNEVHEFLLGDIRHREKEAIYKKLDELSQLLRLEGYSPETDRVLQDIVDHEKEWALAIHSERLAVCYGLISTEPYTTIRVVKNLRVCNDCHLMLKLVAKITRRKIVVRDRNRFHHFENGICSCGEYW
ncbi:hypothetical protein TEA_017375 [Camellia sinensis var. sinensis]|uniref:DYW domain-containing protein n=2 Tax=Camellia sinensis TaxID=4442 RepID=A0A4S4DJJ2_CAMSN|nr:hypothetical protein TEA_002397 [Camellia sinensis var. sinensis]THG03041.1 hypothetical protein TEA_017375 [Camellia sinensis var. sinensis]